MRGQPRTEVAFEIPPVAPAGVARFRLPESTTIAAATAEHPEAVLDAAWAGYGLTGAALVFPWHARHGVVYDRALTATDRVVVLNVLARARAAVLLGESPGRPRPGVPRPGPGIGRPEDRRPRRGDRLAQAAAAMTDRDSERLAERLVSCLPAASFELETLCRLAGIAASRDVETAAVTCEGRSRLLINPDFVAAHCRRDEHLFLLVMHEMWHIILAHTRLWPRPTRNHNIAFDAVINAGLARQHPEPEYRGFFEALNPADAFPGLLLRPPEGWPFAPRYRRAGLPRGASSSCGGSTRRRRPPPVCGSRSTRRSSPSSSRGDDGARCGAGPPRRPRRPLRRRRRPRRSSPRRRRPPDRGRVAAAAVPHRRAGHRRPDALTGPRRSPRRRRTSAGRSPGCCATASARPPAGR